MSRGSCGVMFSCECNELVLSIHDGILVAPSVFCNGLFWRSFFAAPSFSSGEEACCLPAVCFVCESNVISMSSPTLKLLNLFDVCMLKFVYVSCCFGLAPLYCTAELYDGLNIRWLYTFLFCWFP